MTKVIKISNCSEAHEKVCIKFYKCPYNRSWTLAIPPKGIHVDCPLADMPDTITPEEPKEEYIRLEWIREFLRNEVALRFCKAEYADRMNWYIDTYGREKK